MDKDKKWDRKEVVTVDPGSLLILSDKKYWAKRRFIEDVECEIMKIGIVPTSQIILL